MSKPMLKSDFETWYKWLNTSRTAAGLGALNKPGFNATAASTEVQTFINHIRNTMMDNAQLGLADYNINPNNLTKGKQLTERERQTLEDTTLSILRVCVNKICETICNNTGVNQNIANEHVHHSNGVNMYGTNAHGILQNEVCTLGTNQNGVCSFTDKQNVIMQNEGCTKRVDETCNNSCRSNYGECLDYEKSYYWPCRDYGNGLPYSRNSHNARYTA